MEIKSPETIGDYDSLIDIIKRHIESTVIEGNINDVLKNREILLLIRLISHAAQQMTKLYKEDKGKTKKKRGKTL